LLFFRLGLLGFSNERFFVRIGVASWARSFLSFSAFSALSALKRFILLLALHFFFFSCAFVSWMRLLLLFSASLTNPALKRFYLLLAVVFTSLRVNSCDFVDKFVSVFLRVLGALCV